MKAIVVYESMWGNTAAIAHAIAEGMGNGTPALSTAEATSEVLDGVDFIVAGSPVIAFQLPTEKSRANLGTYEAKAPTPPDRSHPALRTWLDSLEPGHGRAAAFESRIWWSPRGATGTIEKKLAALGYKTAAPGERFIVESPYGPLKAGEYDRARAWGTHLASSVG